MGFPFLVGQKCAGSPEEGNAHEAKRCIHCVKKRTLTMVIQMKENVLLSELIRYSIKNLQPGGVPCELRIVCKDIIKHSSPVYFTKSVDYTFFQRLIRAVAVDIIDHLNCKCKPDRIEAKFWEPGHDVFERRMLKPFWDHYLLVTRPVSASIVEYLAIAINDVPALC